MTCKLPALLHAGKYLLNLLNSESRSASPNHLDEAASRSRAGKKNDSSVFRWEERNVRNPSRSVERNIVHVK